MALKKEENTEQVNFDDLIEGLESEYDETQGEYFTITGKEQRYNEIWEIFKNYECDVGDDLTGYPEVSIIPKKDKSYDALKLRVIDDTTDEVLDCFMNFPKWDEKGYIENITKNFDFYRSCFDFIFSVLRWKDETNVIDKDGEEVNVFKKVNLKTFAKYVDQMNKVTVKITEGNPKSNFNSWIILDME